jgi:hypothetical protein
LTLSLKRSCEPENRVDWPAALRTLLD